MKSFHALSTMHVYTAGLVERFEPDNPAPLVWTVERVRHEQPEGGSIRERCPCADSNPMPPTFPRAEHRPMHG